MFGVGDSGDSVYSIASASKSGGSTIIKGCGFVTDMSAPGYTSAI